MIRVYLIREKKLGRFVVQLKTFGQNKFQKNFTFGNKYEAIAVAFHKYMKGIVDSVLQFSEAIELGNDWRSNHYATIKGTRCRASAACHTTGIKEEDIPYLLKLREYFGIK